MRLVLIGDIHLYRLKVAANRLLGKRLLGQSNLWLNRRFRFNHDLLDPLMERVRALEPEMVLLTGDVTTTALEDEFSDIAAYFKPLSRDVPVVIVPGNHDRYTFRSTRHKRSERLLEGLMPERFPYHGRLTDRWHLLGLDSARPQIMLSRGGLGVRQLARARRMIESLTERDGLVVLCHYPVATPPGTPTSWAHDMADAGTLGELLAKCPARVVFLHGHIHRPWHWEQVNGGGRELTYVNAGAPCLTTGHFPCGQGFWEIDLPADPAGPLSLVHHVPTLTGAYGTHRHRGAATLDMQWQARRVL